VRICACPGRDRSIDEKKMTKRKSLLKKSSNNIDMKYRVDEKQNLKSINNHESNLK
jgi:hypothetical protein